MEIDYAIVKRIDALDLSNTQLFGWEKNKSRIKVERFAVALSKGVCFPPIPVEELEDSYFLAPNIVLDTGTIDGGHHRAIAHLIAGRLLPVVVLGSNLVSYSDKHNINIRDINLVDWIY